MNSALAAAAAKAEIVRAAAKRTVGATTPKEPTVSTSGKTNARNVATATSTAFV